MPVMEIEFVSSLAPRSMLLKKQDDVLFERRSRRVGLQHKAAVGRRKLRCRRGAARLELCSSEEIWRARSQSVSTLGRSGITESKRQKKRRAERGGASHFTFAKKKRGFLHSICSERSFQSWPLRCFFFKEGLASSGDALESEQLDKLHSCFRLHSDGLETCKDSSGEFVEISAASYRPSIPLLPRAGVGNGSQTKR